MTKKNANKSKTAGKDNIKTKTQKHITKTKTLLTLIDLGPRGLVGGSWLGLWH
jgi:hypothetical protein